MTTVYDGMRPFKVVDIPDEGLEGIWRFSRENFQGEGNQLPVAGDIILEGALYQVSSSIVLAGKVHGDLSLGCARCLGSFPFGVDDEINAVYMPRSSFAVEKAEMELSAEDMDVQFFEGEEISLFEAVRDQVALATPLRPLCNDGCRGLCPICGADRNRTTCACEETPDDPRFAALKNLKFDL